MIGDVPYKQLVTWDVQEREIVSMYRYLPGSTALLKKGPEALAMNQLFQFSVSFIDNYLPRTIEAGRSVVNRQTKKRLLGFFSVWAGLGAIISERKEADYFSGKMMLSPTYSADARRLFDFWSSFFPAREDLIHARPALRMEDEPVNDIEFDFDAGFKANYSKLHDNLRRYGVTVPPLMNSYITLTEHIQSFGTVLNPWFGAAFETAILVPQRCINSKRRKQFIESYHSINPTPLQYS